MDYKKLSDDLEQTSLFEMWRLKCAINLLLDDPARINHVKRQLRVGMNVAYFEDSENKFIDAEIIEIRRTRVSVRNLHDRKIWNLPLHMINIGDINVDRSNQLDHKEVSRASLKTGDRVGWLETTGEELYGIVIKLNPAKAIIELPNNETWRVPYSMLFLVMDSDSNGGSRDLFLDNGEFEIIPDE